MQTERAKAQEGKGRDQSHTVTSQGVAGATRNRRVRKGLPCSLHLRLLASRTVREGISVV